LRFETVLQSPDPTALAGAAVGQIYPLEIRMVGDAEVIVVVHEEQALGSVGSGYFSQLLRCIQVGNAYFATVLLIRGAECRVVISRE
jgi:hypothetical protein